MMREAQPGNRMLEMAGEAKGRIVPARQNDLPSVGIVVEPRLERPNGISGFADAAQVIPRVEHFDSAAGLAADFALRKKATRNGRTTGVTSFTGNGTTPEVPSVGLDHAVHLF